MNRQIKAIAEVLGRLIAEHNIAFDEAEGEGSERTRAKAFAAYEALTVMRDEVEDVLFRQDGSGMNFWLACRDAEVERRKELKGQHA